MGTRGAIGIRFNKVDKISYNHFDSYPEGLGVEFVKDVAKLMKDFGQEALTRFFPEIRMVNEGDKPTKDEIKRFKVFSKDNVGNGDDWYSLLRGAQGSLYKGVVIRVMTENAAFMHDSLFCEWAYIFNLDTMKIEVYRGFQKKAFKGRYSKAAEKAEKGSTQYYGVKLVAEIPVATKGMEKAMLEVGKQVSKAEEEQYKKEELERQTA